jgi:signal transduction histidine kinase
MTRTPFGASLAEVASSAPAIRIGLTNPGTRFRKLFPYIGTALVLIIASTGYATMRGMAASREDLDHTYKVKSELAGLQLNRARFHEYLNDTGAVPSEESDARFRSAAEALRQSVAGLKTLTVDNPAQQERLEQLVPLVEEHVQTAGSTAASRARAGQRERGAAPPAASGVQIEERISRIISDMDTQETQLLGVRQAVWDRQFHRNIAVLAFAVGACLLLLFTNMHLLREDVRSSRIATQHIRESADSYRALSSRIIGLQDVERRRIGRELHDSVGQSLGALQMSLEQLAARVPASDPVLAESRELLGRTSQEVRTLSQLLHPPLLDVVGFVAAARNYLQQFARRSGIETRANFPDDLKLPSKETELMFFRVLQESLTNVHRHAQATAVDVWLVRQNHEVVMTIQDNGRGMPAAVLENFEAGMASGVGLAGMRERLAEFGGTLAVESSPSGTTVRAGIPV